MTEMLKKNLILFLIYSFISLNKANVSSSFEINIIPEIKKRQERLFLYIDLKEIENTNLYFIFDFNNYSNQKKENKNIAFFELTTEYNLSNLVFQYIFLYKKIGEVNSTIIKNIDFWESKRFIPEEQVNDEFIYYFIIQNQIEEKKNKIKSLLIKISVDKKEGYLSIGNTYTLPEHIFQKIKNSNDKEYNYIDFNHNYYFDYDNRYTCNHPHLILFLPIIGFILILIWIIIKVLYCLINRRKKANLVVVIGNSTILGN